MVEFAWSCLCRATCLYPLTKYTVALVSNCFWDRQSFPPLQILFLSLCLDFHTLSSCMFYFYYFDVHISFVIFSPSKRIQADNLFEGICRVASGSFAFFFFIIYFLASLGNFSWNCHAYDACGTDHWLTWAAPSCSFFHILIYRIIGLPS